MNPHEKPILFSGAMVRAILAGRKTQTRRVVKYQPPDTHVLCGVNDMFWVEGKEEPGGCPEFTCPYGKPGNRLWVRETWKPCFSDGSGTMTRADCKDPTISGWKPSIHMPRARSRITLEITAVRVERLQDISEEDATAEGVEIITSTDHGSTNPVLAYRLLWEAINGKCSWALNPYVWVLEFRRV